MTSVVKNKTLMSKQFCAVTQKLDSSRGVFDGKTTYAIMRLCEDLEKRHKEILKIWLELANRYAEPSDKQNSFKVNQEKNCLVWKEGVNEEEAKAIFDAFDNETHETKWRLDFQALEKSGLSSSEFRAIECVVDFSKLESEF